MGLVSQIIATKLQLNMSTFHRTTSPISISSPMSVSGDGGYATTSKPILVQSNTTSSKAPLAKVKMFDYGLIGRTITKIKGSRKKNKKKDKKREKQQYKYVSPTTANIKSKSITYASPKQQQQIIETIKAETKESQETNQENRFTFNTIEPSANETTRNLLASKGYIIQKKLADTLQGQIYRCSTRNFSKYHLDNNAMNESVVIKVTRKDLHEQKLTILENGKKKKIQEDILKERDILIELGDFEHITRFIDFFEDEFVFCLVMED